MNNGFNKVQLYLFLLFVWNHIHDLWPSELYCRVMKELVSVSLWLQAMLCFVILWYGLSLLGV